MRDTPSSRRSSRKLTTEEIDLRRARGELSCAECKRLKLKCDKKVPCSSCVRRGCLTLCPHGDALTAAGQGSRLILTDTDGLHQKISEMSQRIRQLEDGLALLQSGISSAKHPLLQDELLSIKYGPKQQTSAEAESAEDPLAEHVEAFGTLTIGDGGESRYFGASAGSETLLASTESEPDDHISSERATPELLNNLAAIFPVGSRCPTGPKTFEKAMSMLLLCLPDRPCAGTLCEMFLDQPSWLMRPVQQEELIQNIMNPVYAAKEEHERKPEEELTVSPHKLSILYSVFSLGSRGNPNLPAFNGEAERYHHCARAALALRSMFDSPMVETVQAILFMAYYCSNSAQRYSRDDVWMLVSLGSKVAQSIGMHRDPARWNMDATIAERRRSLFWEIYSFDVLHSLALGRPPSIALAYVDCALPQAQGDSDAEHQFWNWKYQFIRNIPGSILELTLGAKSPDYKAILEVDHRVRKIPVPPALDFFLARNHEVSLNVYMKRSYIAMVRSVAMFYIHKNFFARALLDHPADPLASPYAISFLAAARSASALIRSAATQFSRYPDYCMRWWNLWAHIFSAAMIVGSIVTRSPSSSMAPAAFTELFIAVELFDQAAKLSRRVQTGKDILHRLREKASMLFTQRDNGGKLPAENSIVHGQGQDNDSDILAIFSGQARSLINAQKSPNAMDKADSSPESPASALFSSFVASPSVETASRSSAGNLGMPNAHPSLPAEIFSSGSTAYQNLDGFSETAATDASEPSSFRPPVPMPVSPSFQTPTETSRQSQYRDPSTEGLRSSTLTDPFQQLYTETLSTDTWRMEDINTGQLGSVMSTSSGVDDDWMVFMKESGLA